mmetsp:Transcript_133159/g.188139  ORF Transcript_133159/g.188139 Transcript_133159/m.188139 type:complete len:253 (-) Transcript_133159:19-777(-)
MVSCSPYRRSCHLKLLGGFCFLLARAERTALSSELEKVGAGRHVELHSVDTTLVLSTEEDLLDMRKVMTQEIDKVRCELDQTINETFTALDEAAAAEAQKLQDDAERFLERTHSALFLLQVKEWRLQVAVRHGVFGRCCCQTDSVSNCEWVDRWLLVGHDLQCPARLGTDYLDHYTGRQQQMALNELMPDDMAPLDTLIDACRASSQWRQHVKGRQDRLVEAVPADALKAVKDLAVWPAVDMKHKLVEQIEP